MDIKYKLCLINYLKLDVDVNNLIKKLLFYHETIRIIKPPSLSKVLEIVKDKQNEFVENNMHYSTNGYYHPPTQLVQTVIHYYYKNDVDVPLYDHVFNCDNFDPSRIDRIEYDYDSDFAIFVDLTRLINIVLPTIKDISCYEDGIIDDEPIHFMAQILI